MEAYLLKASAILAIFLITYQVLLRNETFFRINRYFLLSGIGAALLLPLITIREEIAIPMQALGQSPSPALPSEATAGAGWEAFLPAAYLLGAGVLLLGLLKQLWNLGKLLRQGDKSPEEGVVLVRSERIQGPFSFFHYVFYNPKAHEPSELAQILEHEKAHARQFHSLDVLLGRAMAILLWANPLAWWYHKSMQQNLEYLADAQAVRKVPSVKAYQYALLRVSGNTVSPALGNSFYQSPIKKRIVMLHQNRSKTIHLFKYVLILPVLALFLMAFNRETVYVPRAADGKAQTLSADKTIEVTIEKGTTEQELLELKKKLAEDGVDFSYTTVRNEAGEIIDLSFDISGKAENGNPFSGSYNSNSEAPIKPVVIYINSEGGVFFGQASTYRKFSTGKEVHFTTKTGDDMIWVQRSGEEDGKLVGFRNKGGKNVFIVNGEEVTQEKGEEAYIRMLEEREKMYILEAEKDAQTIEVREENGKKIVIVDGEEVSREELGRQGKAEKIFVKMLDAGEDADIEVDVREIRVREDGKEEKIIEIIPEGGENARYKTYVIRADENVELDNRQNAVFIHKSGKDPLIYIDGKKARKKAMDKLDPNQIQSINVLKGDKAVEKYGKKAKDGAIEITTKKE